MTCRHAANDPACSSHPSNVARSRQLIDDHEGRTSPNPSSYEIERVERVGLHLVLSVRYPNCAKCSYEGIKNLVFLNVTEMQVLRWRRIDPHFRDKPAAPGEAPSPAARFPASDEGWNDAIAYATMKSRRTP